MLNVARDTVYFVNLLSNLHCAYFAVICCDVLALINISKFQLLFRLAISTRIDR